MKCLQCGSSRIVTNARVVDRGHEDLGQQLKIEVFGNPEAWIFKDAHAGTLKANVCADCGFVMLSVSLEDAREMERHQKKNR